MRVGVDSNLLFCAVSSPHGAPERLSGAWRSARVEIVASRVHLAIPKRTRFIGREEEKPTASVLLDLAAGTELESSQVEGPC